MPIPQEKNAMCGALLVFLFAMPAQADNEDAIARCARIATVGDRILCLEDALRQSSKEVAEPPVVTILPPTETPVVEAMPVKKTAVAEAPPVKETAAAVTPTAMDEAVPPADESFGLKEKRPPKEAKAVQVTVTSVRKSLTNKFIFETENGQLWLQTDQRTLRFGDVPFEAEIRPASMGSFFLRPLSGGASVRVRREK